ncbi:hypothetical protein [Microvirga aerilata]
MIGCINTLTVVKVVTAEAHLRHMAAPVWPKYDAGNEHGPGTNA